MARPGSKVQRPRHLVTGDATGGPLGQKFNGGGMMIGGRGGQSPGDEAAQVEGLTGEGGPGDGEDAPTEHGQAVPSGRIGVEVAVVEVPPLALQLDDDPLGRVGQVDLGHQLTPLVDDAMLQDRGG